MNELLVEWTLLRESDYLKDCLKLDIKRKLFQQYSTEFGRIDFAHELKNGDIVITELETIIDNKGKLEYCQNQTYEYSKINFTSNKIPIMVALIADETPNRFKKEMQLFTDKYNFFLRYYSLSLVKDLYKNQIELAVKNSGIPLVKPVANNFTHLSALNRFILPFYDNETDVLQKNDFIEYFDLNDNIASSNFKVHKQMCEYFELIEDISEKRGKLKVKLTEFGKKFRDNLNNEFAIKKGLTKSGVKRIELSLEQKRILIECLMNGNIGEKKGKVNILYFLRFIHFTEGVWVPRNRNLELKYVEFANNFLGTNYTQGVISNWLNFICTHCEELGFVERIKTNSTNDRAVLTSFGSRVLGFIEMDLHLKREKIQIPLQL